MRRLAKGRPKRANEVRLGDAGDRGQRRHVERLGVGPVHRVARAQQPSVGFLDGAAHPWRARSKSTAVVLAPLSTTPTRSPAAGTYPCPSSAASPVAPPG